MKSKNLKKSDHTTVEKQDKKNHEELVEELKPLALINKTVNEMNGIKGIYLQETFEFKNVFSWNTTHVFNMFEADSQGEQLNIDALPFIYGIGKYIPCCACQESCGGCCCKQFHSSFEMIVTKNSDNSNEKAPDTLFYLEKLNNCNSLNMLSTLYINDNGRSQEVGYIQCNWAGYVIATNKYMNNLMISFNVCQMGTLCGGCCCKQCREISYNLSDDDGNKGVFIQERTVCNLGLSKYKIGFPPNYNSDQNAILLATCLFLAFNNSSKNNRRDSNLVRRGI